MSEMNLDFTVSPVQANIVVNTNDITVTPTAMNLNLFAGGIGIPANGVSGNSQIQYNDLGALNGSNSFTFNKGSNTVSIANGNIGTLNVMNNANLGSVLTLKITGGSPYQYLRTDGEGNLVFASIMPTTPAGNSGEIQFNDANVFGAIPTMTYDGTNISLGDASNVKLNGGTNGYVLQTDGAGNLTWTAQIGGGGSNGLPGGANTQMQFNDAGDFGGAAGVTFNKVTGMMTINDLTVSNTTKIQQAKEKVTIDTTGSTGTINFDILNQAIIYKTVSATNNFVLNIRGNSTTTLNSFMSTGESVTCTFVNTNGASGKYMTSLTIDGVTVTPKWTGGTPSGGTPNGVDIYNFNIVKTGSSSYSVFASAGSFV